MFIGTFIYQVLNVSQLPDIHMLYIDEEGDAVCLDCEGMFIIIITDKRNIPSL